MPIEKFNLGRIEDTTHAIEPADNTLVVSVAQFTGRPVCPVCKVTYTEVAERFDDRELEEDAATGNEKPEFILSPQLCTAGPVTVPAGDSSNKGKFGESAVLLCRAFVENAFSLENKLLAKGVIENSDRLMVVMKDMEKERCDWVSAPAIVLWESAKPGRISLHRSP